MTWMFFWLYLLAGVSHFFLLKKAMRGGSYAGIAYFLAFPFCLLFWWIVGLVAAIDAD